MKTALVIGGTLKTSVIDVNATMRFDDVRVDA